ncbi:hypothetical protein [Glycomyces algeriensis]|uniref:Uncharacterized protein n=1 Tax=Glycomyces algeriensis TaxID=256037 RepID=A0A9W6LEF6_9ACTN|nr:hypothetical protein [Glycomyces algeriensis]MDA1367472.1 hypothetical protein [Glycomyces algeriensis]MDR7353165.1 hypothetical protein [Glycomyces algeriensis]GLI40857.1 hypothetical protein GALLR39Z86_07070 [Glycomyces algeriensis]
MELAAKAALVRPRMGELERNGWAHELGEPAETEGLPPALADLYRVFDGLSTRMGLIDLFAADDVLAELDKQGTGGPHADPHNPVPQLVQFGNVCYSFALCTDIDSGAVHLVDADALIEAVEQGAPLPTEPLAPNPVAFADAFLFGPRYRELIDLAGGYQTPEDEEEDEWRLLIEELGFA